MMWNWRMLLALGESRFAQLIPAAKQKKAARSGGLMWKSLRLTLMNIKNSKKRASALLSYFRKLIITKLTR